MNWNWELLLNRLTWLAVGFVLGYILGQIRSMRRKVDDLSRRKNEDGKLSLAWRDGLLGILVLIVVYGAFQTGASAEKANTAASNASQALSGVQVVSQCNQFILFRTVDALNERTEFSSAQANANIELQKSLGLMVATILKPNAGEHTRRQAVVDYYRANQEFLTLVAKGQGKASSFPYPTPKQFTDCLRADHPRTQTR